MTKLFLVLSLFASTAAFAEGHNTSATDTSSEEVATSNPARSAQIIANIGKIEDTGTECRVRFSTPIPSYTMSAVNPLDIDDVLQSGVWVFKKGATNAPNCALRVGQQISGVLTLDPNSGKISLEY